MNINLTCVMLVLDTVVNPDIRKNDIQTIQILIKRNDCELPHIIPNTSDDIKQQMRHMLHDIIGSKQISLEQVYTLGDKKYMNLGGIDIIHLGIANKTQLGNIAPDYELATISIKNNTITIGNKKYKFKTIEKIKVGVEYIFETNATDLNCDKMLIEILTTWKYLRSRLDNTDSIFKFMPPEFTLEDVRQVYTIISEQCPDKSNFHKKITKYCTETQNKTINRGHRPSKMYKFSAKLGDAWL